MDEHNLIAFNAENRGNQLDQGLIKDGVGDQFDGLIEKTRLLSFNILSSNLSKNPFEFVTLYGNLNVPNNKMLKI